MRRKNLGWALAGLAALLVIVGGPIDGSIFGPSVRAAQPARFSQPAQSNQKSKTQRYVLTGTVQSIDVPSQQVIIDGDDVPGYMNAMSMPYTVPDGKTLKALRVGDIIRATIVVKGDDTHLDNVTVTGHAKPKGQ